MKKSFSEGSDMSLNLILDTVEIYSSTLSRLWLSIIPVNWYSFTAWLRIMNFTPYLLDRLRSISGTEVRWNTSFPVVQDDIELTFTLLV